MSKFKSASAFIRTRCMDEPTKSVIAAGKKHGLKVTANLVRIVRYKERRAAGIPLRVTRGPIGSGRTRLARATGNDDLAFRGVVTRIGTTRARELLTAIERTGAASQ